MAITKRQGIRREYLIESYFWRIPHVDSRRLLGRPGIFEAQSASRGALPYRPLSRQRVEAAVFGFNG
jgi:hypothetical protein